MHSVRPERPWYACRTRPHCYGRCATARSGWITDKSWRTASLQKCWRPTRATRRAPSLQRPETVVRGGHLLDISQVLQLFDEHLPSDGGHDPEATFSSLHGFDERFLRFGDFSECFRIHPRIELAHLL